MARTLLQTGIGDAQDWHDSQRDALQFMARTIERAAERFDRRAIDPVAHTQVSLGTNPVSSSWGDPEQDPNRVFLSVEATRISVIYLRPTLDLLGRADKRLPVTFYRMLMAGVCGRIHCYDESEAQRYLEYRLEDYEELAAAGEEALEKPQSLEEAKGRWLSKDLKPFPREQVPKIIETLRRGSRARRIMGAAAELLVLSRRRKPHRPDWRVLEECVSQSWFTLPFTILAFHRNDIVLQAFADDEESWMNGGDEPCPGFFTIMRPGEPYPHPALVFSIDGRLGLAVRALLANERPGRNSQIAIAPYWNTSADGSVCLGSTPVPQSAGFDALASWVEGFFNSEFSHSNTAQLTSHPEGHLGLWRDLAGKDLFPAEWLVPAGTLEAWVCRS